MEYATFEELFHLRPAELVGLGENQLLQVATDEDRLRFLKDVFGTASNFTAMQPVVVVEGVSESPDTRVVPDRKLYRALHPSFDRVTVLPGGGKSECIKLVGALNQAFGSISPNLKAVGLLDLDLPTSQPPSGIYVLPVSMVENFLLDPDVIWETIQSVVERTSFKNVEDIARSLDTLLEQAEGAEIGRRVVASRGVQGYYRGTHCAHGPGSGL